MQYEILRGIATASIVELTNSSDSTSFVLTTVERLTVIVMESPAMVYIWHAVMFSVYGKDEVQ